MKIVIEGALRKEWNEKIRPSKRHAQICGNCGDEIGDEDPLVRRSRALEKPSGGFQRVTFAVCTDCGLPEGDPEPCVTCGRDVYNHPDVDPEDNLARTKFVACSTRCRRKHHTERVRKKKKQERLEKRKDTECQQCGDTFTPDRSDAKYCSSACKQRAYRERKKAES